MLHHTSTTSGSAELLSPEAGTGSTRYLRNLAASIALANSLWIIPTHLPSADFLHLAPHVGTSTGGILPRKSDGLEKDDDDNDNDNDAQTPQEKLRELRLLSGLTWEQVAALLNVKRRSIHLWESGKALHPRNEEKLGRLLAVMREINRGFASTNRSLLTTPTRDNQIPLDMLAANKFSSVVKALGRGQIPRTRSRITISAAARAHQTSPHPLDLMTDSGESQQVKVGKTIGFKPIKLGKRDA